MSDQRPQQEPSMEEILASIRRIISEDGSEEGEPAPAPAPGPARAEEPEPAAAAVAETPETPPAGKAAPVENAPPAETPAGDDGTGGCARSFGSGG